MPDGLDLIRHSTAHLLAYAVKELFPDAQVTIGPVIENGFYYDFAYKRPFTPEDLAAIEKRMAELAKRDCRCRAKSGRATRRSKFFKSHRRELQGRDHRVDSRRTKTISLYREGDFIDLCRGPHVPSTGKLKVFKLMKVAGAYWRGDSKNEMLQRIYGTAWAKKEDQDAYLHIARGSREARSPQARQAARSVPHAGRSAGPGVLASARAGRSGSRSSSTCAASTRTTATRK